MNWLEIPLAEIKHGVHSGQWENWWSPFHHFAVLVQKLERLSLNGQFCVKSEQALYLDNFAWIYRILALDESSQGFISSHKSLFIFPISALLNFSFQRYNCRPADIKGFTTKLNTTPLPKLSNLTINYYYSNLNNCQNPTLAPSQCNSGKSWT